MPKAIVEFWPNKQYEVEINLPLDLLLEDPSLCISECVCEMGEWPGSWESMAHGIRCAAWVRKIIDDDGTVAYDANNR